MPRQDRGFPTIWENSGETRSPLKRKEGLRTPQTMAPPEHELQGASHDRPRSPGVTAQCGETRRCGRRAVHRAEVAGRRDGTGRRGPGCGPRPQAARGRGLRSERRHGPTRVADFRVLRREASSRPPQSPGCSTRYSAPLSGSPGRHTHHL